MGSRIRRHYLSEVAVRTEIEIPEYLYQIVYYEHRYGYLNVSHIVYRQIYEQ